LVAALRITPSKYGKRDHETRIADHLWQFNDIIAFGCMQSCVKTGKIKD
jgi:hypothetical protein